MFTLLINTNIPNVFLKISVFLVYNKYLPIERNYKRNSIVLLKDFLIVNYKELIIKGFFRKKFSAVLLCNKILKVIKSYVWGWNLTIIILISKLYQIYIST